MCPEGVLGGPGPALGEGPQETREAPFRPHLLWMGLLGSRRSGPPLPALVSPLWLRALTSGEQVPGRPALPPEQRAQPGPREVLLQRQPRGLRGSCLLGLSAHAGPCRPIAHGLAHPCRHRPSGGYRSAPA